MSLQIEKRYKQHMGTQKNALLRLYLESLHAIHG